MTSSEHPKEHYPLSRILDKRQSMLRKELENSDLSAIVLNPGPSLFYFTGLQFHLSERPVVGIFSTNKPLALVLPELEAGKTEGISFPLEIFPYGENPQSWKNAFRSAFQFLQLPKMLLGVEPRRLRYLELRFIETAAPYPEFSSFEEQLSSIRMIKGNEEIVAMRKAVGIAQNALQDTLPVIKARVTEREIASELTLNIIRNGSNPVFPFSPIVSGGPNSANPHASPTDRPLQPGDLLVIDWGATYRGYVSDITRTFAIEYIDPKYQKIAHIVKMANEAGRSKIKTGVTAHEVDQATRSVIEDAGYGEYFIHRTGHGIGLEGHEAPYIRAENDQRLIAGMTFTVEPGIYLAGKGGVRIEDDVMVTASGVESLTDMPRDLKVLD